MLTLRDLNRKLKQLDEVTILELLDIRSDELVDRFPDKIEEQSDYLVEEFEDADDEGY